MTLVLVPSYKKAAGEIKVRTPHLHSDSGSGTPEGQHESRNSHFILNKILLCKVIGNNMMLTFSPLCIPYLQNTKHYELLNYSEHGTTVDNVLYSCDFSEKILPTPPSSIVAKVQNVISKLSQSTLPTI